MRTSDTTKRLLTFAALQTTDEESYLEEAGLNLNDLGIIELRIFRVRRVERRVQVPRNYSHRRKSASTQNKVHERMKKVGMHCVGFSEEIPAEDVSRTSQMWDWKTVDRQPYVTFIFKYNPLDVLIAKGVAQSLRQGADQGARRSVTIKSEPGGNKGRKKVLRSQKQPRELDVSVF